MSKISNRSTVAIVGLVGLICIAVTLTGCMQSEESVDDASPLTTESPISEPTEPPPTVDHVGKGNELLQARRYEQAVDTYSEAIEAGHDLARAHAGRGKAYAGLRRFREALEDYNASLRYERTADVLASRCNALRLLAKPAEAMNDCQEATSLDPNSIEAHLAFAMLYLEQNNHSKARAEVNAAKKIDQESVEAQYVLAQIEMTEGNYEAAVNALSKCIELDPSQPRYYWDRGFIYYSLGKIEQAETDMRAVLEYGDPETDSELMFNAGKLLRSLGEDP